MKSMTGYGEASHQARGAKVSVQVRSLNHRHLDLQLRVPREYLLFEEEIRKVIRGKVSRGRIDLFINRSPAIGQERKLELDEELLRQYLSFIRQAKRKFQLSGEVGVSLLSNVPELFRVQEIEANPADERQSLFIALETALKRLEQSREREGRQLNKDMQSQINHLKKIATGFASQAAEIGKRLEASALRGSGDATGINKEASDLASLVLKGDINEEVVRLKSHVAALAQVIREKNPIGKKIDFMLQEIQRELNTIGSKVPQLSIVQLVLAGKERVEKIREQTQNIE
ncbi:MAG TPA: YicC/YloC family endoribonuclease [Candidatus Udaeobacter sp.]|jgi:uncharacterized protein (TIGR00255 family)|nr:YicC/YloC family endoribonuclease [Candidatus Udaeobacter sp.]